MRSGGRNSVKTRSMDGSIVPPLQLFFRALSLHTLHTLHSLQLAYTTTASTILRTRSSVRSTERWTLYSVGTIRIQVQISFSYFFHFSIFWIFGFSLFLFPRVSSPIQTSSPPLPTLIVFSLSRILRQGHPHTRSIISIIQLSRSFLLFTCQHYCTSHVVHYHRRQHKSCASSCSISRLQLTSIRPFLFLVV